MLIFCNNLFMSCITGCITDYNIYIKGVPLIEALNHTRLHGIRAFLILLQFKKKTPYLLCLLFSKQSIFSLCTMTAQSPSLSSSSSSSLSSSSTTTMPNQISSTPSSSTIFHVNNIKNHIPEVLDFTNYLIWKTLFLNILHCHQVQNHIDGTSSCPSSTLTDTDGNVITNPAYSVWK